MRVRIALNGAGDLRVQLLRDSVATKVPVGGEADTLVCSSEFQDSRRRESQGVRPGYGALSKGTIFGASAKRTIREVSAVVDRGNRDCTLFLTGTLPGSTPAAVEALASYSGWCVSRLTQWLRDRAHGSLYFGVWEYQKRGALHIHLCVQLRSESEARVLARQWKRRWIALLRAIGKTAKVNMFARVGGGTWAESPEKTRTDAQFVAKSVGAYLGKYLSKGSVTKRRAAAYPPSRWWFCSRALLAQARLARRELSVRLLSPQSALGLFERLGSFLATTGHKIFPYVSPVDTMTKGVIALLPPVVAALCYREIVPLFRCLISELGTDGEKIAQLSDVQAFFRGRSVESKLAFDTA